MELADALDSKSCGSDTVSVRPRSPAPKRKRAFLREITLFLPVFLHFLLFHEANTIFQKTAQKANFPKFPQKQKYRFCKTPTCNLDMRVVFRQNSTGEAKRRTMVCRPNRRHIRRSRREPQLDTGKKRTTESLRQPLRARVATYSLSMESEISNCLSKVDSARADTSEGNLGFRITIMG